MASFSGPSHVFLVKKLSAITSYEGDDNVLETTAQGLVWCKGLRAGSCTNLTVVPPILVRGRAQDEVDGGIQISNLSLCRLKLTQSLLGAMQLLS